jgi:hypothetical protein
MKLAWGALVCLLLVLSACGSDTSSPVSDPPGALVRLQRNSGATTLPGDLTVFSNGGLQLYFDDRGALRKTVAPADLAGLQGALTDPALSSLEKSPNILCLGAPCICTARWARGRRNSRRYSGGRTLTTHRTRPARFCMGWS